MNEDVGRVKSRSCYCQDRVPRRDTGARRRVKRLRDSLTPGRANPRQAERARHTERESEREPTVKGTVNFPFASFILNENVPLVFSLVSFPAVFFYQEEDPTGYQVHRVGSLELFFFFLLYLTLELKICSHCYKTNSICSSKSVLCKLVMISIAGRYRDAVVYNC